MRDSFDYDLKPIKHLRGTFGAAIILIGAIKKIADVPGRAEAFTTKDPAVHEGLLGDICLIEVGRCS